MENPIVSLKVQRKLVQARLNRMKARIQIAMQDESEWIRTTNQLIEFMVMEKTLCEQEIKNINNKIKSHKTEWNKKYKC
jgi:hypothetical protein